MLSVDGRETISSFDLAIIGGGVNGCGIARDAAGRGWSVFLCEKGDLASGTSSASTKLVHGGLRYLEYFEFRLVREALLERETLWRIAPHIIWPLRFVLPFNKGLRPAWVLRLGLFLYDHIGGRKLLPPTRTLQLRSDPAGEPLKAQYALGFEYSDCWVEDSRLVVLNARDAANRGAVIAPRTTCVSGVRQDQVWRLVLKDERSGETREIRARALVNAAGPWVGEVLANALRGNAPASVRLVKGSHIVVPRLYAHDRCYFFQNADRRIFFAIPYEQDFTLIGTTDLDYVGDPGAATASDDEIAYLCDGASEYFSTPVDKAAFAGPIRASGRSTTTARPKLRQRRAITSSSWMRRTIRPLCSAFMAARSRPTVDLPNRPWRCSAPICPRPRAWRGAGPGARRCRAEIFRLWVSSNWSRRTRGAIPFSAPPWLAA